MGSKKGIIIFSILITLLAGGFLLLNRPLPEGTLIMTRISSEEDLSMLNQKHLILSEISSSIVQFNPHRPESSPKVLTKDFTTAHSPDLDKESKRIVFTGKKSPDSNQQIWMMNLNNQTTDPVTDESMNCFDPFFLPNDNVGFSCEWQHDDFGNGSFLFSMDPEAERIKRITFHPHIDHSGSMLHDGRILWTSQQIYPEEKRQILMALRPDGTNSQLFYELPEGFRIISKARENNKQQIYFSAKNDNSDSGTSLYRFSYINPVTSTQNVFHLETGLIQSLYPMGNGSILLSYQNTSSKPFGIFEFNESSGTANPILTDDRFHYLEPVVVQDHPFDPKVLPTALNDEMDTGIIVFVDPVQNTDNDMDSDPKIIHVEGLNGLIEEFVAAKDGSFYIHVTAKMPVRFSQLSESGEVLNGPYPWVWVMPGDRRGFTGWDPVQMIAPPNQVPQAINEPAVQIIAPSPADMPLIVGFNRANEVRDED